jgi:hypothetical protein
MPTTGGDSGCARRRNRRLPRSPDRPGGDSRRMAAERRYVTSKTHTDRRISRRLERRTRGDKPEPRSRRRIVNSGTGLSCYSTLASPARPSHEDCNGAEMLNRPSYAARTAVSSASRGASNSRGRQRKEDDEANTATMVNRGSARVAVSEPVAAMMTGRPPQTVWPHRLIQMSTKTMAKKCQRLVDLRPKPTTPTTPSTEPSSWRRGPPWRIEPAADKGLAMPSGDERSDCGERSSDAASRRRSAEIGTSKTEKA